MKNLTRVIGLVLLVAACQTMLVADAEASNVSVTYTGDNLVNGMWLVGDSTAMLSPGPNNGNWEMAHTQTLDLEPFRTYGIIWEVFNYINPDTTAFSPAGFLAQIESASPLETASPTSSSDWQVGFPNPGFDYSDFDDVTWMPATEYAPNSGPGIWYDVHGGPIENIDGGAQWIWTANNDPEKFVNNYALVKAEVRVVPIPAAVWLLGAGLIGLAGIRRKFGK